MRYVFSCIIALLFLTGSPASSEAGTLKVGLFVGDVDAATCDLAISKAGLAGVEVRIFTEADIKKAATEEFVRQMDVTVVDIMPKEPGGWLLANRGLIKPDARLYAVRTGADAQKYLTAGFVMDERIRAYYNYTSSENISNLLRYLANKDLKIDVGFAEPVSPPKNALYHPDAPGFFIEPQAYLDWYKASGRFHPDGLWDLTIIFPNFTLDGKKEVVDALLRAYEARGINVMVLMQETKDQDKNLESLVASPALSGRLGSITGFTFKFASSISHNLLDAFEKANCPVFNVQTLFYETKEEWLSSEQGISPVGITLQFATPELSGLVEPTVIGVKEKVESTQAGLEAYRYAPVNEHVQALSKRVAKWHNLKKKPNKDKKICLIYYNHGAGKQNIGASYLNVFKSIAEIANALKKQGYDIKGELTEEQVKDFLLRGARNIGSWAPGELDELIKQGNVAFISMSDYKKWFDETPSEFQQHVKADWQEPETSLIMVKDGRFVIPHIKLGNLIVAPQPVRGFTDDPEKLYHSTILYPHHQYNAFYFWLRNVVKPDAMISLGTHGTHEWLPGKQAGLSWMCAPEVLIDDIPSVYPYIVDDVGEGIQAKRRGRAVVIDHMTPPFKQGGVYEEYAKLSALINELTASDSGQIQSQRIERISQLASSLGLDKELDIKSWDDEDIQRLEHYLIELKTEMIPFGLHTFGVSPEGEALTETAQAIASKGGDAKEYEAKLNASGGLELEGLLKGLAGGYIRAGSGNDPIRNPESLPTGRNFYGFDPEKVPSKEAWKQGEKAAKDLIQTYRDKHANAFPDKVGLVLWSVETIRDEGINVATALALMGIRPVWDKRDKVSGLEPIQGAELGRPRIDVLLQMSGLFRDTFPKTALMLDNAVKMASTLSDVENFIRRNSEAMEKQLILEGKGADEAKKLSLIRLYSQAPGAYGTKVDDMTGASGMWEKDDAIAQNGFIATQSHGYSSEIWGYSLTDVYKKNLKDVDATVHTMSSNLYGTMDNDDMFQYLGGLSMAVRKESGKSPEVFVSTQRKEGRIEAASSVVGRELRSRYLNPKWIQGMKQENYAGAREIAEFVENMWGWQVTVPEALDNSQWEQTYQVYVEDKYQLDIKKFMEKQNPWAYQSITARMLEAVRKGYWDADKKVIQRLAAEYVTNVVEKGVACCDHTCNNPLLNQMTVSIVSVPGVLSPEIVEKFRAALEKATGKKLEEHVAERKALIAKTEGTENKDTKSDTNAQKAGAEMKPNEGEKQQKMLENDNKTGQGKLEQVDGYKMEEEKKPDEAKTLPSSGMRWTVSFFVLLLIAIFMFGASRRKKG